MRATTPNVLRVFDGATDDEMTNGLEWYADANKLAVELAGASGDIERAAAVIAVLSPLKPWEDNIRLARLAYEQGGLTGGTLRNHVVKVNKLLVDKTPVIEVVSGRKVTSFWHGIVTNGDTDIVTVDRHAYDVAIGKRLKESERVIGIKAYRECERAYVRAGRARGLSGAQVQAVTWCAWRNKHAGKKVAA